MVDISTTADMGVILKRLVTPSDEEPYPEPPRQEQPTVTDEPVTEPNPAATHVSIS